MTRQRILARLRRLNGWQRLWLVVCSLLLVPTALAVAYLRHSIPDPPPLSQVDDATIKQLVAIQAATPNSAKEILDALLINEDLKKAHEAAALAVSRKRMKIVLYGVMAWALCCAVLYMLGKSGAWIARGFRNA